MSQHQRHGGMDPKKALVKDLVLEAFQDEKVQEMFSNLKTQCHRREGDTEDTLRDLLLDMVVESYMLSNSRKNATVEADVNSGSWHGLDAASNTDTYMMAGERLELKELHNTNISNNKQQNLTTTSLPCAGEEVSKESVKITDVHDANDTREVSSCNSRPQNASNEGSIYKRVLSALRLTKKEHITTDDDRCLVGSSTSQPTPCDPPEVMSDHDDKLRRIWMRLSDPASDDTSSQQDVNKESTMPGVDIDASFATQQQTSVDDSKGLVCEEEPSLLYNTFMGEMQEAMGNQLLIEESEVESNLDEYESASDNDADLESWHSNEHISLSRASSSSFLTASDHLDEIFADPEEEVVLVKTIRPQFLGKYYLQRLANARQTAAEIKARKPEPRVKIDKPCRLDTNLTYAVRQSLKRSLPLIAGKNKLSALMMMADGMFDEMSLDRDLDDLAWPFDPLAELRESGLAMVDYMDPHPAGSATMNTSDMKDQSSPSEAVTLSTTAQDVFDIDCVDPVENKDDDDVETLEPADLLNLTPIASSGHPTNLGVSDAVAIGPLVPFQTKQEAVSSFPKESFQNEKSLRFLFKPLKSVVDTIRDADPFRVLVNQIHRSPTDVLKNQLLPFDNANTTKTSMVPISDQPQKLHLSAPDETYFNTTNTMSNSSTDEARSSADNCYRGDDLYERKELSQTLDLVKEIRPQFLGRLYLKRLANARQTAAEIKDREPETRVKIEKPCRLDTNLMYSVRQSLKRSLPLIAGKNRLSALMMMANGMFDEMSLDRDLDDLAWPYDPLAELRKSGLAMVDYVSPCTTDDLLKATTTFDTREEISSVEILSSSMGKNLLPKNSESKDVSTSNTDSCLLLPQPTKTKSLEDRESPRTYIPPASIDYLAVPPSPRTGVVPSDDVLDDHQDCLDFVSVDCGQISASSSDSIINTDDVTTGLLPCQMCPPLRKEDDHQSVDSALGEENSATSLDKDDDDDECEITNLTQTNLDVNNHEQGLEIFCEPLLSISIDDDEVLFPTVAGTVSSNVRLFERLAIDGRESSLKSSKLDSSEFSNKPTISEDIKKRAQVFENVDVCRPLSSPKQTLHSTEENFHTVNIKTQVAMFEKLFGAIPVLNCTAH